MTTNPTAVLVGKQHFFAEGRVTPVILFSKRRTLANLFWQTDAGKDVIADGRRKVSIDDVSADGRYQLRAARKRLLQFGWKAALNMKGAQLGQGWGRAGWATDDLGWPLQLPKAIGLEVPEGIVTGLD